MTGGDREQRAGVAASVGVALSRFGTFLGNEAKATGLPLPALLVLAVGVHVAVLVLALNPWHPDEHFQILEFAWARAGSAPLEALPWEYAARIRPTLQPTLAMGLLGALRAVGVTSPWTWTLALRLGTLAVSFGVVLRVVAQVSPGLDRRGRQLLWLAGPLLWFSPLFMFRFSSENLGGLALVAALPLVEREEGSAMSDATIGSLLGLSFVFRFQMAFAVLAVLFWVATNRSRGFRDAARIGLTAAAVLGFSSLLDRWFYGNWVFTPWRYLESNLLDGVASSFGVSPWYSYLVWAPMWMAPPLSVVLLLFVGAGLVAGRRSVWTWAFLAFVFGHSVVAHKEGRFLLPLLYLAPVVAAQGAQAIMGRASLVGWRRALAWVLALENAALALVLVTPAAYRTRDIDAHYMRWLWDVAQDQPGETVFVLSEGGDPYHAAPLEANVYRHPRVRGVVHDPGTTVPDEVPTGTPSDRLLLVTRGSTPPAVSGADADLVYVSEPGYRVMFRKVGLEHTRFIRWLEDVDGWTGSGSPRKVYRIRAPESPREGGP